MKRIPGSSFLKLDRVAGRILLLSGLLSTASPAIMREITARDFGAIPDDGKNDLPGLLTALEEAKRHPGPVRLSLEPGTYELDTGNKSNTPNGGPLFLIKGARDFTFDGKGASLMVKDPTRGCFAIEASTNITLRDFSVDYDPLPFTQGVIVELETNTGRAVLRLDEGYPPLDAPWLDQRGSFTVLHDRRFPLQVKDNAYNHFPVSNAVSLGAGRFSYVIRRAAHQAQVGDPVVHVGRQNKCAFVEQSRGSSGLHLEGLILYASPGACFIGAQSRDLRILRCRAALKPGRLASANADGLHAQSMRGELSLEDCLFEGLSDDAVNIYTAPFQLKKSMGPSNGVWSSDFTVRPVRIGDRIALFDGGRGALLAERRVAALDATTRQIRFDGPIDSYPLGDGKEGVRFFDLDAAGNGFRLVGNTFRNIRGTGMFLKASGGLVASNKMEHVSSHALHIRNISFEGLQVEGLFVRDNDFIHCGFDHTYRTHFGVGVITVGILADGAREGSWRGQKALRFERNTIDDWLRGAFVLRNAEDVRVVGNTVGTCREPMEGSIPWIEAAGVKDLFVTDNVIVKNGSFVPGISFSNLSGLCETNGNRGAEGMKKPYSR